MRRLGNGWLCLDDGMPNTARLLAKEEFRNTYGYWPTDKVLEAYKTLPSCVRGRRSVFSKYGDISPRVGIHAGISLSRHNFDIIKKGDREPNWLLQLKQEKRGLAKLYSQELLDDVEEWKQQIAQAREAQVCYTCFQFFFYFPVLLMRWWRYENARR